MPGQFTHIDPSTGNDYVIKNLLRLTSTDAKMQAEAMSELIALGTPAVLPLLHRLSYSDEQLTQQGSLSIDFEERTEKAAVIRDTIRQTLVGMGERAVGPLVEVLETGNAKQRELAARFLNRIGEPAVEPVLPLLQHKDADVRAIAALALAGIRDEKAAIALQNALRAAVVSSRNHRAKLFKKKMLVMPGVLLAMFLVDHFIHPMSHVVWQVIVQSFVLGSIADTTLKLRRNAVSSMAQTATPQMVGAFAACLEDRDKAVQRAALEALKRLLPQVQASDKPHISNAEMHILLKRLGGRDNRLTLAILKAVEQIGDERALPKVEAIAAKQSDYPAEVITAAQECLPYLRKLAEASRQANTLLRASEPTPAPETLLRAATGMTAEQPDQLLRPQL